MASKRYPRGITKHAEGWRISVRVRGHLHQQRFKPSTPQADVEAALMKARSRWSAGRLETQAGSLNADVGRYLADYFAGRQGYDERKRHLDIWVAALGADTRRASVTRDDIARVLNGWRAGELAADTCNKRRTALLALYHALDGKGGSNPVREIPKFRPPAPLPRGIPYGLIKRALSKLPRCKTRARLTVMAYTGIRPGQLMRLTPDDWDRRQQALTVPGTAKGRGTKPYVVPLSSHAHKALQEFDRWDAWGRFTSAPMARMWKAAAAKAKLPAWAVPYDLRHSFGTAIYQATGDLHAARKLLGHSSLTMTERYTLAAVPSQQRAAVKAFEVAVGRRLPVVVATPARSRRNA